MTEYFNTWVDFLRLGMLLVNLAALVVMYNKFRKYRNEWTIKILDIKLALLLWCLSAITSAPQNILADAPFGPKTIIGALASAVMLRAVLRKGPWGWNDD